MKRKVFMFSAIVLAIGGAFVTKANTAKMTTGYFVNPGCISKNDCTGGTVTCLNHFTDASCLNPVSPKKAN